MFVRSGKNADVQAAKLDAFVNLCGGIVTLPRTQFSQIDQNLRAVKAGQYRTLALAIDETLLQVSRFRRFLQHANLVNLENLTGVGPKTSRFFVIHTRGNSRVAALDTRILRFIGDYTERWVPVSTPTGKRYAELEKTFLNIADKEGVDPAAMDLAIWKAIRNNESHAWRTYLEK